MRNNNGYSNAKEMVHDVNLIWFNEHSSYEKGSPFYNITTYLQNWFKKHTEVIPNNETENWMIQ